jgi:hypothetical protein
MKPANKTNKPHIKFPARKISDTLMLFAAPMLDPVAEVATKSQMEQMIEFAWLVWNAVVMADVDGNATTMDGLRTSFKSDLEAKAIIDALVARKRELFSDDERIMKQPQLMQRNGEYNLRVEATSPSSRVFESDKLAHQAAKETEKRA